MFPPAKLGKFIVHRTNVDYSEDFASLVGKISPRLNAALIWPSKAYLLRGRKLRLGESTKEFIFFLIFILYWSIVDTKEFLICSVTFHLLTWDIVLIRVGMSSS